AGKSYEYTYSLVASTNSCSATSTAVTWTEPTGYYTIATEPVIATTTNGGAGTSASPWVLYGGSSTLVFTATVGTLSHLTVYINANGVNITTMNSSVSPYAFSIDPSLQTGIIYSADFVAQDTSGNYYTETVFFTIDGGVCTYNGPNATSSATQTNNGLALATPWSLQPGQSISWSASDLSSTLVSVVDPSTSTVVK